MLGKGFCFTDCISEVSIFLVYFLSSFLQAARYPDSRGFPPDRSIRFGSVGYMFVCEVALNRLQEFHNRDYEPDSAGNSYDSAFGRGSYEPDYERYVFIQIVSLF
jgi:hypothetical protein